jgi:hypothetical protein
MGKLRVPTPDTFRTTGPLLSTTTGLVYGIVHAYMIARLRRPRTRPAEYLDENRDY